jgi:hypothetical protein
VFVRTPTRPFGSILPLYAAPDNESGQAASDNDTDNEDDAGSSGRTFTQADVDKIAGRRASEGEKAAARRLLEELGVKDVGEAKKVIEAARKAAEKDKTELERERTKATEAAAAAESAKREAATAKAQLKIDRLLLDAGAQPGRLGRLSKMVFVEIDDDADDDAIKEAIESVKTDFAEAFTKTDDADSGKKKTGPAPSGAARDGAGSKKSVPVTDAMTRGRERARRLQGRDQPAKTA